jgi:hypothetical protein
MQADPAKDLQQAGIGRAGRFLAMTGSHPSRRSPERA